MAKKQTFLDILGTRLGELPDAARMVIALDPRRIMEVPNPFLDGGNRDWQVFVYDQNDLSLRKSLPSYQKEDKRLLIVALGQERKRPTEFVVDVSYIPDLIEEAIDIIDCSPQGLLSNLIKEPLPPDVFEEPLLSLWAQDLNSFVRNLSKYQKIAGKGGVMNRFDAMAVSLATGVQNISIEDLANLPSEPIQRLTFYLRTVAECDLSDLSTEVLQGLILGPNPDTETHAWYSIERPALLRFLYFGLAVIRYAVPNGIEEIQRLGLLGFDVSHLGKRTENAFALLRKDIQFQQAVTATVEDSPALQADVDKLVNIFKFGSFEDALNSFSEEPSPAIACSVSRFLIDWLMPSKEGRTALSTWPGKESLSKDLYPKTPFTQNARRYRELIEHLSWSESTIAKAPNPPGDLLTLINTYRTADLYLLELKEAETRDIIRLLNEQRINNTLKPYLEQLRGRIDVIVTGYDKALAKFITSNFSAYTHLQRLNTQILRNLIQAGASRKERVWIIILDGMRLDTWYSIILPKLYEIFEIDGEEQLYLATLPSYTDVSRVAFFAGKLPPYWKDYYNNFTSDHNILLSRYLDLGKEDSKKKLRIISRMEEKTEQMEIDFETAQYRCLIFNISDDWIHGEQGSLVRINEIVKEKFEKMVLPELAHRVKPGDIMVVASDHGFIELRKDMSCQVNIPKSTTEWGVENIKYRYIENGHHEKGVKVTYDNKTHWILAVGSEWFERPKPAGKPARYSHGGISMAEMVIPAVRVKKRVEKKVEILLSVDSPPPCSPGDKIHLPIRVRNQGTIDTNVLLSCRLAGRLVAEDSIVLPAGAGYNWSVSVNADPKANQISINAQYTLPGKEKKSEKRLITIPIKELGARVEIDTSALDVFKDY
jgi:hypothetical protein